MICPKCFNTNDDNNNNCVYCGNVLREQVQQPVQPVAPVAPEVPVQPVTPEVPVAPVAEAPVQGVAPVAQEPVQPQVQPQTQGFDVASMGLTAKQQQAPQQQLSDDPFMNQVLQQQAQPKKTSNIDFKKYVDIVVNKSKELIKNKFVLMGVGAVAAVLVGVGIYNIFHKPSEEELMKAHPDYTDAFYFKGDDDKYALISKEGKMLTDFEYEHAYDNFLDGYSVLSNDDGEYGIIKDNGKMSVKFGKYDSIMSIGGLYLVTKGEAENYKAHYITGSGKVVINDIVDYNLKTAASNEYLTAFEYNKNVLIYNYKGKKITTLKYDSDLFMHSEDVYSVISSGGKVVIVNAQTGKVLANFKDKETYCINGVNEDGSIISINTCDNSYLNFADEEEDFKLIVNGKVVDTESECDSVSVQYETVMCVKDSKRYLLNSKYERSVSLDESIAYKDGDNYAIYNDGSVLIYKNGKKVKTIDKVNDLSTGVVVDTYLVEKENDKKVYYNLDGEELCDVDYYSARNFDENERAMVYEDREYFLINKEGKQVAGPYDYVNAYGDFYVVTNKDDKQGVVDKDGKVIVKLEYEDIDVYTSDLKYYLALETDDKYDVYSMSDEKNIITDVDDVNFNDYYMEVINDKNYTYFTYNGKQFYEK